MAEWRPVPGYEGYYEVSIDGRVRGLDRMRGYKGKAPRHCKAREMKRHQTKAGYYCYTLSKDGITKIVLLHRIIAEVFVGRPKDHPERDCVNHINGIKTDNRPENLEWVTKAENNRHAFRTGLMVGSGRKLTDDQVRYIRNTDKSASSIAKEWGLDVKTVWNARVGKTYKEVKDWVQSQ